MNKKLWIGIILAVFFLFIAFFGPWIAPYAKDYHVKSGFTKDLVFIAPPLPPDKDHWFGTDNYGQDLLTLMLYGAKYTIFTALIVAFLRAAIGAIAGMYLGINRSSKVSMNLSAINSIPVFIIVFYVLNKININSTFSPLILTVLTGAILVVLGIPGISMVVQGKTQEIRKKEFVMASETLGASKTHILFKQIFPHIKESILIIFVNDIMLVLATIGQLGVFQIFLGGTVLPHDTAPYSLTNEWAGLIGQNRSFFLYHQWIVMFPLLGYLLLILSVFLISRGLEKQYKAQYSKVPYI